MHVWSLPNAIFAIEPLSGKSTCGNCPSIKSSESSPIVLVWPSPSWPTELSPQHISESFVPLLTIAQA